MKPDLIEVGRIKEPSGLNGKMQVIPLRGFSESYFSCNQFRIGRHGAARRVDSCFSKKKQYIISLDGIDDIAQVELLVGESLYIQRDWLPALEDGKYYNFEILGCHVIGSDGRRLGPVVDVFSTGSNDVLVVDPDRELMLPAVDDFIINIDVGSREILVDSDLLADILE